ncbi:MAG: hypothetical protein ACKPH7_23975 [Planktothrix sp.]|uniref:hypothetical protein n=1 Tax=Planktothrix sp. TaxID=3088171 RepID=UPI0038D4C0B9
MNSKEVLEELKRAKDELESSELYKRVKELETLYMTLSNKEYEDSNKEYEEGVEYIKTYYTQEGYECRDISDIPIEFSKDYIGYEGIYNFIILPKVLPPIHKLIITNLCTQDYIILIDNSKYLLGDVVIGNGDTEENAWDDIYVSSKDRERIKENIHRYS